MMPPDACGERTRGHLYCYRCKLDLPLHSFALSRIEGRVKYPKKYNGWCKECRAAYQRKQRGVTRKQVLKGSKEFPVARTCTNCHFLRSTEDFYRVSDSWCKECDNQCSRSWRKDNSEYLQTLVRTWQMENPNKVSATVRRRNDRVARNGIFVVLEKDVQRLKSDGCANCLSMKDLTLDHIIPVSRGGRHSVGNLMCLCRSCNSKKNSKLWIEFKFQQSGFFGFAACAV